MLELLSKAVDMTGDKVPNLKLHAAQSLGAVYQACKDDAELSQIESTVKAQIEPALKALLDSAAGNDPDVVEAAENALQQLGA